MAYISKSLALFALLVLLISCSNQDQSEKEPTESIQNISINDPVIDQDKIYKEINSNEYCWLINDRLELYAEPKSNSTQQGTHFEGEVLKVLDSQIIDKELWVKVEFKLEVKTGYEDQFADGRVTPSGLPIGWIGGAKMPLINCK